MRRLIIDVLQFTSRSTPKPDMALDRRRNLIDVRNVGKRQFSSAIEAQRIGSRKPIRRRIRLAHACQFQSGTNRRMAMQKPQQFRRYRFLMRTSRYCRFRDTEVGPHSGFGWQDKVADEVDIRMRHIAQPLHKIRFRRNAFIKMRDGSIA